MNLYKITIKTYDEFYVIANDPTEAYNKLLKKLEKSNLYFSCDRELKHIELIAKNRDDNDVLFSD